MKTKKITALLTAGAMMLTLWGCGSAAPAPAENSPEPDQSSQTTVQETQEPEAEAEPASGTVSMEQAEETKEPVNAEEILAGMTMDEKISQMIIPAMRTWDEENVTDLSACPELAAALQKHQYGGVILYGANITGTEQLARLVYGLQANNMENETAGVHVPYIVPVDEEGGIVTRIVSGTRMNGNMAIGATVSQASANARMTGQIIGAELASLGIMADFAPVIDVNNNPANPVIGTRSFSDDPAVVSELGREYAAGLKESGVIPTFKHFPGHGDTATDSHIGTPSVEKTYDEIKETELVPFQAVIDDGADMIMTAHITYPLIDEEVVYGDGETKGFYPATMSRRMISEILRGDMGYDGVVVTDALEMDAIRTAKLVPGEEDSVEYRVNIAREVINSGVDILLLPLDMNNADAVSFYDEYISGLMAEAENGSISENRIDESVLRILKLKEKYGILDGTFDGSDIDDIVAAAKETVGAEDHHSAEAEIASQAVTLLKNEDGLLPFSPECRSITVIGRVEDDKVIIDYTVSKLKEEGLISQDCEVYSDYYFDQAAEGEAQLHFTDELKENIAKSEAVIAFSYTNGFAVMEKGAPQYEAIHEALEETHKAGGKFILLSENLPYDAARYKDADAVIVAYMGAALGVAPTERGDQGSDGKAYNANMITAMDIIFGAKSPVGSLPVNVPELTEGSDGKLKCGDTYLYERGYSLGYDR